MQINSNELFPHLQTNTTSEMEFCVRWNFAVDCKIYRSARRAIFADCKNWVKQYSDDEIFSLQCK